MPTKPSRPRDLAKEQLCGRIIRRHHRTDLPVRAFCQREGLKIANFLWWRRELTRRDQEKTVSHPVLRPRDPADHRSRPSSCLSISSRPTSHHPRQPRRSRFC